MSIADILKIEEYKTKIKDLEAKYSLLCSRELTLTQKNKELEDKLNSLNVSEYEDMQAKFQTKQIMLQNQITQLNNQTLMLQNELENSNQSLLQNASDMKLIMRENESLTKSLLNNITKIKKAKEVFNSIQYSINKFNHEQNPKNIVDPSINQNLTELMPNTNIRLAHMSLQDLRKLYNENNKQISNLVQNYSANYTTKGNQAIYKLMTLSIRSELQNILYNMKYDKLDKSVDAVIDVCNKYLEISITGSQKIEPSLRKFIGQLEYFAIYAVKIEYNYYVKKEQQKQEQAEIREKMRQEAAERKALAEERQHIEAEEQKYKNEIADLNQRLQLPSLSSSDINNINSRILEIQSFLSDVIIQKDKIITLQNGLAGTVYIISNKGAFGENIFKIGMTRRLDPMDRIRELSSASVPFPFDIHSFIFSDRAVELETELHKRLNNKRINKVNLRKEFFNITIDELEQIVAEIQPTAEFNKTLLAEQYNQSLSSTEPYTNPSDLMSCPDDTDDIDDTEDEPDLENIPDVDDIEYAQDF